MTKRVRLVSVEANLTVFPIYLGRPTYSLSLFYQSCSPSAVPSLKLLVVLLEDTQKLLPPTSSVSLSFSLTR